MVTNVRSCWLPGNKKLRLLIRLYLINSMPAFEILKMTILGIGVWGYKGIWV